LVAADIPTAALTKVNDTNVTLTLGGAPTSALVNAASLTLGWTGQLAASRGGTGVGSYAVGDLLYASGSTTLAKLADVATGNALISGGVSTAPSWGKIGLSTHVSGTLPVANGGTGAVSLTQYGVLTGNGTSAVGASAAGTAGYMFAGNGASAPTFQGFQQAGTGVVTRTWQGKARDIISVMDFSGVEGNGVNDDTAGIQAAFASLSAGQILVFPHGVYVFNGAITHTTASTGVHFDGCKFLVGDTGANGTLTDGGTGKIGLLFQSADHIVVSGEAQFVGTGTVGSTTLAGMVFDSCDYVICSAELYYENMAAGRFVLWCDYSLFGNITAYRMKGQQTFDVGTAGTAEVVVGCRHSVFGRITSKDNYKPIRYLSTAVDALGAKIDNQYCYFGFVTGTAASGSTESCLIAFRSAQHCYAEGGDGNGFSIGCYFVNYSTDTGWLIKNNVVGHIGGTFDATSSSGDAAVSQVSVSGPTIGHNRVISVNATCSGEGAIICYNGALHIDYADITGSAQPVQVQEAALSFGGLVVSGQTSEAIVLYQGSSFSANSIDIQSGAVSAAVAGAIRYNTASGSGGLGTVRIGAIKYRQGSAANTYVNVIFDNVNGFESWLVGDIDGTGSTDAARFASDDYTIKRGTTRSVAVPTGGTYSVGTQLWKSNAASGGTPGWVCTTAGTPGTWKAMANLA
jgi:hypothetical protein